MSEIWKLLRGGVDAFIEDEALSRGAAIAFYAMTAFAPVLYIAAAIAGLAFGREAATSAITAEIGRLIGHDGAKLLQIAIRNGDGAPAGFWPNIVATVALVVAASGMFGEMQAAMNAIWKARPKRQLWWDLLRTRLLSLGLVLTLGFLLLISLVVSAGINAVGARIDEILPIGTALATVINFAVSFALIALLFAAIFKALPDTYLEWSDVAAGAAGTALLFSVGQYLIALYLGTSNVGARYGAGGGLIVLLVWIYYTAQIFLLGAEFTKVYSQRRGSKAP